MPSVGLGVYRMKQGECKAAVLTALRLGYRHVDTAQVYRNEADVGAAVAQFQAESRASRPGGAAGSAADSSAGPAGSAGSDGPREEHIFVTSKVFCEKWGYEQTYASIRESVAKLQLKTIDLMLLHSPGPAESRAETWRAMEDAKKEGLVGNIGVSNFGEAHIEKLMQSAREPPAVNQIEIHPFLQRRELVKYCRSRNILVQAYSPLTRGQLLSDERIAKLAQKHGVSPAQVLIRWSLQSGFVPLPKSVSEARQRANLDVFDFSLDEDSMAQLDALESATVTGAAGPSRGPDPPLRTDRLARSA